MSSQELANEELSEYRKQREKNIWKISLLRKKIDTQF